jgi:DNA-binding PadR family transcriptional regulator
LTKARCTRCCWSRRACSPARREEDKRNKRFYRLSTDGEALLGQLLQEWQTINASINSIL